ncbi:nucleotide exchange factor GrpE [Bdellovibrionota bacterium FG-1]
MDHTSNENQTPSEAPAPAENQDANAATADANSAQVILELEAQLKEKTDKYLYLYAEFDNFKKRSIKERSDLIKFGWESVARELILVLDNFERALSHIPANTDKNLTEGLKMIASQFRGTLQKQGMQQVQVIGKEFDPELAEAVGQIPSDQPAGTVVREELPGYTLHGRLLRPANVILSTGQANQEKVAN